MDFAWVVDALRRGLRVTRNKHNWNDNAQVRYLYMAKNDAGNHVIRMRPSMGLDFEWQPSAADILDATDWEEYVEPRIDGRHHTDDTMTVEEHQRMHSGEKNTSAPRFDSICKGCFNCIWRKKGQTDCGGHPNLIKNAAGIVTECSSWILRPDMTEDVLHDAQVKEPDHDEETNKAIALVARNIAENLVELLRNPSVQRILQMEDVPLSKGDTNHA